MATSAVVAGEEKKEKKGGEHEAIFVNKHRMIDAK